ncbi:MAG TPA: hypothetical protein PLV42_02280 [bacterium]|nr:hypothetical protein [bacterium]
MKRHRGLLLIGATAKDSGKTTLCERLIARFSKRSDLYGVKVTIVHGERSEIRYSVTEETRCDGRHDTGRMLIAGARKVFWVRCDETTVGQALDDLFLRIPAGTLIVCESNSVRNYLIPDLFLMVSREGEGELKKSAAALLTLVDHRIVCRETADGPRFSPDIETALSLDNGAWVCHLPRSVE